ncbi:MAG: hypothetical protein ACREK8_03380 [Gemmatimonadales bacterium]
MTRWMGWSCVAFAAGTVAAAPVAAQTSVRDILIVDSLSPAKTQLRDYVAELRDTLNRVDAIHARIVRANASGMASVVESGGHQLLRTCRVAERMAALTQQRVSMMKTDDIRGEQALSSFRNGLTALGDHLRTCQANDSTVMSDRTPDRQRIVAVAGAASDAINQYDQVRDGLLALLSIRLPVKGYIPPPKR